MNDTAAQAEDRVKDHESSCITFAQTWLDRELTVGETVLVTSALEFAFNGEEISYDPNKGPYKPGKYNDLTPTDKDVLNWVWAYLRSNVEGAKDEHVLIGARTRQIKLASESPNYQINKN